MKRPAAGKAERQCLALGQRRGSIRRNRASGDIGITATRRQARSGTAPPRAVKAAPNGPISTQAANGSFPTSVFAGRQRQTIHRAARHQAIALGAGRPASWIELAGPIDAMTSLFMRPATRQ